MKSELSAEPNQNQPNDKTLSMPTALLSSFSLFLLLNKILQRFSEQHSGTTAKKNTSCTTCLYTLTGSRDEDENFFFPEQCFGRGPWKTEKKKRREEEICFLVGASPPPLRSQLPLFSSFFSVPFEQYFFVLFCFFHPLPPAFSTY